LNWPKRWCIWTKHGRANELKIQWESMNCCSSPCNNWLIGKSPTMWLNIIILFQLCAVGWDFFLLDKIIFSACLHEWLIFSVLFLRFGSLIYLLVLLLLCSPPWGVRKLKLDSHSCFNNFSLCWTQALYLLLHALNSRNWFLFSSSKHLLLLKGYEQNQNWTN